MSNVSVSEVAVSEVDLSGNAIFESFAAVVSTISPAKKAKKGRPFYAAKALFEAGGFNSPITDELVKKVDEECGKPNKTESLAWLKIAAQMCAGWEEGRTEKK